MCKRHQICLQWQQQFQYLYKSLYNRKTLAHEDTRLRITSQVSVMFFPRRFQTVLGTKLLRRRPLMFSKTTASCPLTSAASWNRAIFWWRTCLQIRITFSAYHRCSWLANNGTQVFSTATGAPARKPQWAAEEFPWPKIVCELKLNMPASTIQCPTSQVPGYVQCLLQRGYFLSVCPMLKLMLHSIMRLDNCVDCLNQVYITLETKAICWEIIRFDMSVDCLNPVYHFGDQGNLLGSPSC